MTGAVDQPPTAEPSVAFASEAEDVCTRNLVARYLATLGHDPREALTIADAPLGLHWSLAPEVAGADALMADGIADGGIIPTLDLPRRMWAGSELTFLAPIPVAATVLRRSRVIDVTRKQGRSGPLAFAAIEHLFSVAGELCLRELQSIAYRAAQDAPGLSTAPAANARPSPQAGATSRLLRRIVPDQAMLFRYSAITFNAHRIHYDRSYASEVEHYPDLLVHGPLMASLLLDACAREFGPARIARIVLRAVAPACCGSEIQISEAADGSVLARSAGILAMTATPTLRDL